MRTGVTAALLVAACSAPLADAPLSAIGPPGSGWTSPSAPHGCAPPDVSPRLHFAEMSHFTWMRPDERAALVAIDLTGTARADVRALDRAGVDAAVRRIAPVALEARGQRRMAGELRALPPIRGQEDLRGALEVVRVLGDQLAERSPERRVMTVLQRGIRESMTSGFPALRCAEITGHGTVEAAVAAAAVEAGAPRARVTEESVAALDAMARAARSADAERSLARRAG
ncbi:MAG TPA: hypothetical protein VIL20_03185 [Sandaracinaceae bacterium]